MKRLLTIGMILTFMAGMLCACKMCIRDRHHIALWDVLASCEIAGASDSSIRNAKPNDLSIVLSASQVRTIFVTGKTAQRYYLKSVSYTHLDVYKRQ